jgi:uncharacterized protein (DUF58 family)
MRPSRRLVALVLGAATLSILYVLAWTEGGLAVATLWGVLALAGLVDMAVTPGARRLSVSATAPGTGYAGATGALAVRIATSARSLPPRIALRLSHGPEIDTPRERAELPPPGTTEGLADLPLDFLQRGSARLTRLGLCMPSRLGLFELLPAWPLDLTIDIVPDVRPVTNGEIQTQMLPLLDGLKDMNLRGEGSEFHQLREFLPGMEPRGIDWKRSARMRSLVARETRAEKNHQIVLCLDTGHLMGERIGRLSKLDHAINAALALTWAGGLGGDNVGFFSFDARPGRFLPPRPGRRAFGQIQKHSASLVQETVETNHTLGLTHLNGRLSRRSLVVVFSDFVDSVTAELLVENLAVITRQHLVLYVALSDPALAALAEPADGSMTAVAEAVSARQFLRERQAVLDRLRRMGILCLDTPPERLTAGLISRYIDIKAQEMI